MKGFCLFVCFFFPFENISLIRGRHHNWWSAKSFYLCSTLMTIEHWGLGFLSVSHLLWHENSVQNGHLEGPVTLTSVAQRLAVERSLPILHDNSLSKTSKQCLKLKKVTVLPRPIDSPINQFYPMPVMPSSKVWVTSPDMHLARLCFRGQP